MLLKEVRFLQGKFVNSKKPRKVEDISKAFSKLVLQGKLSAAMKLLDNESSSGLLDLSPDVLQGLHDKHPEAADIVEESLLYGPIDYTPPNVYVLIDKESIYNSASKTRAQSDHLEWTQSCIRESYALRTLRPRAKFLEKS